MALCVARTFLPLLPGGDGADLRGKGMNKSGIKVNLLVFYHAKIFGTQSGQGKIMQRIPSVAFGRLPATRLSGLVQVAACRAGKRFSFRLQLFYIIKNNRLIVCLFV